MNPTQTAANLASMDEAQQRAYLSTLNPAQLVAVGSAAIRLRRQTGLSGLDFGSLLKNIGGALLPLASIIPGAGPIIAAAGGALMSSFSTPQAAASVPQTSPQPAPQAAAQGFTMSPAVLLAAGVALVLILRR